MHILLFLSLLPLLWLFKPSFFSLAYIQDSIIIIKQSKRNTMLRSSPETGESRGEAEIRVRQMGTKKGEVEFAKKNPSMMLVCENGACWAVYLPPDCCSSCWYFNDPLSL